MTSGIDHEPRIECGFSLRKLEGLLKNYTPPSIEGFDPFGSWKQQYTMFALQGAAAAVGEFSLKKTIKGQGKFAFTVQIRRSGNSGYSQFLHAELQCQEDALATPSSWVFESKLSKSPDGPAYLQSGRRSSARVSSGALTIQNGLRTRSTAINGHHSNEWTLLEAVNRLPGEQTKDVDYTLINEFDAPHAGHRLSYGDKAQVVLPSGPIHITGYCDLGPAVVPTTYWVDEHHRLLFVCTGIMVYVLSETNGSAGKIPERFLPHLRDGAQK